MDDAALARPARAPADRIGPGYNRATHQRPAVLSLEVEITDQQEFEDSFKMIARVDAGPIHAVTRFDLSGADTEEKFSTRAYLRALQRATGITSTLADPKARFAPLPERLGHQANDTAAVSRSDGLTLRQNVPHG